MAMRKQVKAEETHPKLEPVTGIDAAPRYSGTVDAVTQADSPSGNGTADFTPGRAHRKGSSPLRTLNPDDRLCRKAEVIQRVGLSESSIWRLEQEGRFPGRIRVTQRCTVWLASDIRDWIADPANYKREVSQ